MAVAPYHHYVLKIYNTALTGAIRCVKDEGMPRYRNPFEKGNMYIKFDVTFPPQNFASEDQLKVSIQIEIRIWCCVYRKFH